MGDVETLIEEVIPNRPPDFVYKTGLRHINASWCYHEDGNLRMVTWWRDSGRIVQLHPTGDPDAGEGTIWVPFREFNLNELFEGEVE